MEFEGSWLVFYTPWRLSEKGEMDSGLSTGMKLVEEVRSGEMSRGKRSCSGSFLLVRPLWHAVSIPLSLQKARSPFC